MAVAVAMAKLLGRKWQQKAAVENSVRVMVRFKPLSEAEQKSGAGKDFALLFSDDKSTINVRLTSASAKPTEREPKTFTLDGFFPPTATQDEVWRALGKETVESVVRGYNGTLLAYGQTGSGKTHSMFGPPSRAFELRGIVPRAAEHLFSELRSSAILLEASVKVSFVEIYNEKIRDLLSAKEAEVRIRETPEGAVFLQGAVEESVSRPEELLALIAAGDKRRTVAKTSMNDTSSRSHSIVTITIKQKLKDASIRTSKLHFGDLAGSERVGKSGAEGDTLTEAQNINLTLSALGNCIKALTEKNRPHIPYRDSVLTYLLKDSLGGNTRTSLLATCSCAAVHFEETLSTLQFATRAKKMTNHARINAELSDDVQALRALVVQLRQELGVANGTIADLRARLASHDSSFLTYDLDGKEQPATAAAAKKGVFKPRKIKRRHSLWPGFKVPRRAGEAEELFSPDSWSMPLMMAFPYENVLSEAELQALNKKLEQEISALESKQDDGADAQRRAEADSALEQEFAKSKNQIESLLSSILGGGGGGGTQ